MAKAARNPDLKNALIEHLEQTKGHLERLSGRQVIDNNALPHPLYAGLCRAGAHAVSEAFLQLYLETTFLADRKTRLLEWEKEHPEVSQEPSARK